TGGLIVEGDGALGHASREIRLHEAPQLEQIRGLVLQELRGLVPGRLYSIVFWVKPLQPRRAVGRVGDTWPGGWTPVRWTAAPVGRWQRVEKHLLAKKRTELLAIELKGGPAGVRLDGVTISPAARAAGRSESPAGRNPRRSTQGVSNGSPTDTVTTTTTP